MFRVLDIITTLVQVFLIGYMINFFLKKENIIIEKKKIFMVSGLILLGNLLSSFVLINKYIVVMLLTFYSILVVSLVYKDKLIRKKAIIAFSRIYFLFQLTSFLNMSISSQLAIYYGPFNTTMLIYAISLSVYLCIFIFKEFIYKYYCNTLFKRVGFDLSIFIILAMDLVLADISIYVGNDSKYIIPLTIIVFIFEFIILSVKYQNKEFNLNESNKEISFLNKNNVVLMESLEDSIKVSEKAYSDFNFAKIIADTNNIDLLKNQIDLSKKELHSNINSVKNNSSFIELLFQENNYIPEYNLFVFEDIDLSKSNIYKEYLFEVLSCQIDLLKPVVLDKSKLMFILVNEINNNLEIRMKINVALAKKDLSVNSTLKENDRLEILLGNDFSEFKFILKKG